MASSPMRSGGRAVGGDPVCAVVGEALLFRQLGWTCGSVVLCRRPLGGTERAKAHVLSPKFPVELGGQDTPAGRGSCDHSAQ